MTDFDPAILGGSVKRGIVNPDLQEERNNIKFDMNELESIFIRPDIKEEM